jgi:hypothetical protein
MSQQELLKRVIEVLTAAGIDYMVTGSIVSSLQGEPRATHDIDLVVALPAEAVAHLVSAFPPPDYYLSADAIRDALRHRSMFNLLSLTSGEKADFWILTEDPFDQSRFSRRRLEEVLGSRMYVSTPEDTILMKLRWATIAGGSEKQFKDALRVYEVQRSGLDVAYLNHWAKQLGVGELWQRLQSEAQAI